MSEGMRGRRATEVLLAIALLSVSMTLPGLTVGIAAPRSTPSTGTSLTVQATGDYGYQPDLIQQVPTNSTITVTFVDASVLPHTLTIIGREGWVVPTSYTPTQINALSYGNTPPALFNSNVTGSGDRNTSSFISPGRGWYEFVCTVSGHFQNGMYGFIAFGEDLPPNLTSTPRQGLGGLSLTPLDDVGIGLALVAILLLGYFAYRRRAHLRPRGPARVPPDRSHSAHGPAKPADRPTRDR